MKKIYNPTDIEKLLYKEWEEKGYFKPNFNNNQSNYCIMIPPPNLTGNLHMGHAFQQTIIDILIRYNRMQGKNTLYQVGTDHAGIATQMIVERKIFSEENKNKYDYGREAFIQKIKKWKMKSSNLINYQIRRLGNSVDWERELFTMDNKISNVVKEVFIRLYRDNLIYRDKGLVNWDTKLCTAISDLEVEYRELKGFIWKFRYPLADGIRTIDGLNYLTISTTRPETLLGDSGVAVNPKDPRYCNLIGFFVILPLVGRRIPIIGDEFVDMKKCTGCVKITPAHDFNDYEVGKRHGLPMINIFTYDGKIRYQAEFFNIKNDKFIFNDIPVIFRGLERFVARDNIVSELEKKGLLVEVKKHNITIPYGDRSGEIIEPMLTNQWFVRTKLLAKVAVKAVKKGDINFIPKQYENIYFSWMCNIHDWCISRQLWWGHRIPAWYDINGNIYVGNNELEIRKQYFLDNDVILRQDEDVLDTWFSSGLWTFSTLGWPEKNKYLDNFHPTNVVVSGFDIIFFWISRMIMLTMYFVKDNNGNSQVPFKTIYITGLFCDEKGRKMSKSNGNVIDPLDMIDGISLANLLKKRTDNLMKPYLSDKICKITKKQYPNGIEPHGTDALRFTLSSLASTSRYINWDMKRLKGYRNFCNKLWNASRFILINTTKNYNFNFKNENKILLLTDRWILSEFNKTVKYFREALDNYRFDLASNILYEFVWDQFCNWYLELTKSIIINGKDIEKKSTCYTLVTVLESLLRLAHPIIPFITEIIWKKINFFVSNQDKTIMLQSFPIYDALLEDKNAIKDFKLIKQIVIAVRTVRTEKNIISNKMLVVLLRYASIEVKRIVNENIRLILNIAKLNNIIILKENDKVPDSFIQFIDGAQLLIPMFGIINKDIDLKLLEKKLKYVKDKINHIFTKLNNKNFVLYAPKKIIKKEHEKLKKYKQYNIILLDQIKIIINSQC